MKIGSIGLKICGVTRPEDVALCCKLGVTYVGFNLHPKSKRFVSPANAGDLWRGRPAETTKTYAAVVLVDVSLVDLRRIVTNFPEIKVLQFHGNEDRAYLEIVREEFRQCHVWKAVRVGSESDISKAQDLVRSADLILFDSKAPPAPQAAEELGGSGKKFDWTWVDGFKVGKSFGIAGGINPEDVAALKQTKTSLIDICSGVESAPGIKDASKLATAVSNWKE